MGEGRFFSTDMVSLAGRGLRRQGSGRRSGEIGGWKSEIGDRSAMFWAVSITRSVMAT